MENELTPSGEIMFEIIGGMIVLTIMILLSGIKVVNEYDRLVVFRFGKALHTKGPGVQLVVPLIDRAQLVDVRTVTLPIEMIEETTHDHYSVKVSALCMFKVADPKKMVTKIDNAQKATRELAQATLRNCIRQHKIHSLMTDRRRLNTALRQGLNKQTNDFGIQIQTLEIKHIKITRDTKRLMARSKRHEGILHPPALPKIVVSV